MIRFSMVLLICLSLGLGSPPAAAGPRIKAIALFKDKAMLSIDGQHKILRVGEPGSAGVRLIAANSQQAVIEVDGQTITLSLSGHIGSAYKESPAGSTLHIAANRLGMYMVDGRINGQSIQFLVDTGASHIALNSLHARKLGIPYQLIGEVSTASTASGIVRVYGITLDRVRIGDIELHDVPAFVHDGRFPVDALLGMSFLGQLKMERSGNMLKLQKKN